MKIVTENNEPFAPYHIKIILCLFLALTTLSLYAPVHNFDFINFDDDDYVYNNPQVNHGFTKESLTWALTTFHASNWHPVTWFSHMLDCQLFGLNPGAHHLVNVIFHTINAILLFLFLNTITGHRYKSFFVALFFSIHPMHVESVAWISERKDLLSTLFFILTLFSYVSFTKNRNPLVYLLSVCLYAAGLMAKPMLVTLPCILILIDFWPLSRIHLPGKPLKDGHSYYQNQIKILFEKLPFFILSAISSAITIIAQTEGGAVLTMKSLPIIFRLSNSLISYTRYISKAIVPVDLALLYPHPGKTILWGELIFSISILILISILIIKNINKRPWLVFGFLFYFITLLPVIGFVQVGFQSMADRYTYIPFTGLFIIVSWGGAEILNRLRLNRTFTAILIGIVSTILFTLSSKQIKLWENSITLFTQTLKITKQNEIAHNNLGLALFESGKTDEAITHYKKSIEIFPLNFVYINLGVALAEKKNFEGAISSYEEALKMSPDSVGAHYNLGIVFEKMENWDRAIYYFREVIRLEKGHPIAHVKLGNIYKTIGDIESAQKYLKKAINLNREIEDAYNSLGIIAGMQNRLDEAVMYFSKALNINPDYEDAHKNMGLALREKGQYDLAIYHYERAIEINSDSKETKTQLELTHRIKSQILSADYLIKKNLEALAGDPNSFEINRQLGYLFAFIKNYESSVRHYEKAESLAPFGIKDLENLIFTYTKTNNITGALKSLKKLKALKPGNPEVSYQISRMYAIQRNEPDTLKWLKISLDEDLKDVSRIKTDGPFNESVFHEKIDLLLKTYQKNSIETD